VNVGIIGVGNMGLHMARRLAEAGYTVHGFDPRPDIGDRLADVGAAALPTGAQVASVSGITILMVLNNEQADAAIWGDDGFAAGADEDSVLLIMSSLAPSYVASIDSSPNRRFQLVDAPVSGGVEGAERGSLTVMVAGEECAAATVQPILELLGSKIVRVGARPGLGATMKAINQAMYFTAFASAAEMIVAGAKAGLDPDAVVDVIGSSSGGSWALGNRVPLAWRADYLSGGSLAIAAKDLATALQLADELGTEASVIRAVAALVDGAMQYHQGAGDDPLIVDAVERLSGFVIAERPIA